MVVLAQNLVEIASLLLQNLADQDQHGLLSRVLEVCRRQWELDLAAWVRFERGQYDAVARCGEVSSWPYDLLADALDAEQTRASGPWLAIPSPRQSDQAQLLVLQRRRPAGSPDDCG